MQEREVVKLGTIAKFSGLISIAARNDVKKNIKGKNYKIYPENEYEELKSDIDRIVFTMKEKDGAFSDLSAYQLIGIAYHSAEYSPEQVFYLNEFAREHKIGIRFHLPEEDDT